MSRYIDADALPIKDLDSNGWLNAFGVALEDIENAPTVDAVSVVRCKECKWYSDMWGCTEHDEVHLVTNPDDFCSIGERSEE